MKLHRQPGSQASVDHVGPTALITMGGRMSAPGQLRLCSDATADGRSRGGYGILQLALPDTPVAIHTTLSTAGLRWLAGQAIAMAEDLEATAAREAAEVIERAKATGK